MLHRDDLSGRFLLSAVGVFFEGASTQEQNEADKERLPLLQRFREEGCPNCEEFLHLAGSPEQIDICTSQVFEGLITLANPTKSWVARWQRLDGYVRGVYAIKVSGQLPDDVRTQLEEEHRIQYIP